MNSKSTRALVVGLALVCAAACNKDKKKSGEAPPDNKPVNVAPKAAKAKVAPAAPAPSQPAAKTPAAKTKASGCAKLFATASGTLPMQKGSCIEGAMEEKGHEFDSKACNGLENAWPVGMGDFGVLWASCQAEQKFNDATCNAVLAKCF